jgi:hypothetical protein
MVGSFHELYAVGPCSVPCSSTTVQVQGFERPEVEGLGRNSMALRHPIDDDGVDRSLGLGPVGPRMPALK